VRRRSGTDGHSGDRDLGPLTRGHRHAERSWLRTQALRRRSAAGRDCPPAEAIRFLGREGDRLSADAGARIAGAIHAGAAGTVAVGLALDDAAHADLGCPPGHGPALLPCRAGSAAALGAGADATAAGVDVEPAHLAHPARGAGLPLGAEARHAPVLVVIGRHRVGAALLVGGAAPALGAQARHAPVRVLPGRQRVVTALPVGGAAPALGARDDLATAVGPTALLLGTAGLGTGGGLASRDGMADVQLDQALFARLAIEIFAAVAAGRSHAGDAAARHGGAVAGRKAVLVLVGAVGAGPAESGRGRGGHVPPTGPGQADLRTVQRAAVLSRLIASPTPIGLRAIGQDVAPAPAESQ